MGLLKYAILGLLSRESLSGYDISKEFNRDLVNFWNAKLSQIYPELKNLTENGYVTYEVVIQGETMEKKMYSITPKGRNHFITWLNKHEDLDPTPKDKFKLRTYFCDNMTASQLRESFTHQHNLRMIRYNYLRNRLKDNYSEPPGYGTPEFGDYLALTGGVKRERAYLDWIEESIMMIPVE